MEETLQNKIIAELKKDAQDHPDLVSMDDEALQQFMAGLLEQKTRWAKTNDPEMCNALLALNYKEKRLICNAAFSAVRRLGVLGQIIADPDITEVMINGYKTIFVEKAGKLKKLDLQFENAQELETIITKFVSQAGRAVNESEPIVDTHLEDGSRVNVVMPPVALNGPILTIRRFPEHPITMEKLIALGSITQECAEFLEKLVKARYSMVIGGGTGSGKTTFLAAMSEYIPRDERLITIEDNAELRIRGIDNLVRLEAKMANMEGAVSVTIRDLIKSALRMRPDRIIVGEVRGGEAMDMLQALNTGHEGSLSTAHANSARDMLSRLETMVLMGVDLPLEAIRRQIASGVDILVHLGRMRDKSRKLLEVTEVCGFENGEIRIRPLYQWQEGKGLVKTASLLHVEKLERAGIEL